MDRTTVTLDAQFDTLDAHVEGVGNAEAVGSPAGLPELVRETATVLSIARLMSTWVFSNGPGCENSFIARTMWATCATPSRT